MILLIILGSFAGVTWADSQDDLVRSPGENGQDDAVHNDSANERVTLTTDQLYIEADNINYDLESGLIEAEGEVEIEIDGARYNTETLTYNVKEAKGIATAFKGEIKSDDASKDYLVTGEEAVLTGDTVIISKATLTRCPHKRPDYLFTAREMTIREEKIQLKHVVLRIKGVPAFYLPRLSFDQGTRFPDIHVDLGGDDGIALSTGYDAPLTDHLNWFTDTKLSLDDESWLGFGLQTARLPYSNRIRLAYNFDGFWQLDDHFAYELGNWRLTLGGSRQFSDTEESQLGMTLTRKYWESPWGRWQIGGLVRDHTKEIANQPYGGLYTGVRLDYNPHPYVVLSYLGIASHTDYEFGDLMEDFGIGDNWLYEVSVPFRAYTLGMDGVYNSDGEGWIHQRFSISRQSCAFRTTIGYDFAEESFDLSWRLKF